MTFCKLVRDDAILESDVDTNLDISQRFGNHCLRSHVTLNLPQVWHPSVRIPRVSRTIEHRTWNWR